MMLKKKQKNEIRVKRSVWRTKKKIHSTRPSACDDGGGGSTRVLATSDV